MKYTPEVIELLQKSLISEYHQWHLYYLYKSVIQGEAKDGIVSHFEEHADDEIDHIDILQRYLVNEGVAPTLELQPIDDVGEINIENIINLQIHYESIAVENYTHFLGVLPENCPLRIDIENILIAETEHMHDLTFLLPN
jgi:bacterioferritin (cytochrome b1)